MEERRHGRQLNRETGHAFDRNAQYTYGNVATQPDVRRELDAEPRKKVHSGTRKNREKSIQMNLPYVIFLAGALCVAGYILVNYLQIQADITTGNEKLARLENEYLDLRTSNDETYTRIMNSVDLAEIERIAREELGMHYATDGQVVVYTNETGDYVKQYADIE